MHDVSNTLTVILGWAEEAVRRDTSPDAIAYALAVIADEARRARVTARRSIGVQTARESERVDAIALRVAAALRIEASKRSVEILCEGKLAHQTDGERLGQILTNLLLNAIAFSDVDSVVTLRLGSDEQGAFISVLDEGPGIPAQRAASLFDGVTTRKGGAGVGLAHARELTRSLGGDLELVPSKQGSHFRVTLPAVTPSYASIVPPPALSSRTIVALQGARVLLLEDDVAVTSFLKVALEARGVIVSVSHTLAEVDPTALYDAVVVDVSPIAMNADAALAQLRALCPHGRLIVATGNPSSVPVNFLNCPMVQKPFEVAELVRVLST